MWGPDTQSLLSSNDRNIRHDPDVFADPHTKAFLIVQAYLENARLPISDYVNDTKSIVENLPRLMAAMEFIASDDVAQGSLDLMTEMVHLRQVWTSRTHPNSDPLVQLRLSARVIHRIRTGGKPGKDMIRTLVDMRRRDEKDVVQLLHKLHGHSKDGTEHLKYAMDVLYSMPLVLIKDVTVSNIVDSQSGKTNGKVRIDLEIKRDDRKWSGRDAPASEYSLSILLGTFEQGMLLSRMTIPITRHGSWALSKEITFDINAAKNIGGSGKLIAKVMINEVRGLDFETTVSFPEKLS